MKRGLSDMDKDANLSEKKTKTVLEAQDDDYETAMAALVPDWTTLAELRRVCIRLSLPTAGGQTTLRDAIITCLTTRKFDSLSIEAAVAVPVPLTARLDRGVALLKDPAFTFLALPRDMMARALLPHVERPMKLGLTCTYMTQICVNEQRRRCQMIFRPYFPTHSLETFSPVAMSLLEQMIIRSLRVHALYSAPESTIQQYNRARAFVGLATASSISPNSGFPMNEIASVRRDMLKLFPDAGACGWWFGPIEITCIKECITAYGSVETALRRKNEDLIRHKIAEDIGARRLRAQDERLASVNDQLFGGIPVFKLNAARDDVEPNGIGGKAMLHFFVLLESSEMLSRYVVNGKHDVLDVERVLVGISAVYAAYRQLLPGAAKAIRLMGDAVFRHTTNDNWVRMGYWMRLLFCPDSEHCGALLSWLDSLAAEWINELVASIGRETRLPTGFYSKEEVLHVMILCFSWVAGNMTYIRHCPSDETPEHVCYKMRHLLTLAGHDSQKNWISTGKGPFGVQWRGNRHVSVFQRPLILIYTPETLERGIE